MIDVNAAVFVAFGGYKEQQKWDPNAACIVLELFRLFLFRCVCAVA